MVNFIIADFYEIDFMKRVILVKVDEVYKSLLTKFVGRKMKVELDAQSFCWSLPLNVHTLTTPLLY